MNIENAKKLVELEIVNENRQNGSVECVILEDKTIEKCWGWVFFYQSKAYIESGDFRDMLGGNAPIIVNRESGELVHTGTAQDINYYIDEYESKL